MFNLAYQDVIVDSVDVRLPGYLRKQLAKITEIVAGEWSASDIRLNEISSKKIEHVTVLFYHTYFIEATEKKIFSRLMQLKKIRM